MALAVGGQLLTDPDDSIGELWARLDCAPDARPPDIAAVRRLRLFGAFEWELACIPSRAERPGKPQAARAVFATNRGPEIREREAFWARSGLVATPNRFPFAWPHCLVWGEAAEREPSEAMWAALNELVFALEGAALNNSVGASASIALAHAHLLAESGQIWPHWPAIPVAELDEDLELLATDPAAGLPVLAVGVRGSNPRRRAHWLSRLLRDRACAAVNVIILPSCAWLVPRREETGQPRLCLGTRGCGALWALRVSRSRRL